LEPRVRAFYQVSGARRCSAFGDNAAILLFLFFDREILFPFILAAALAFVLTPAVDCLPRKLCIPRWVVAAGVYLLVLVVFGVFCYWVGGLIIRDVTQIVRQFPHLLHKLLGDVSTALSKISGQSIDVNGMTKVVIADLSALFAGTKGLQLAGYGVAAIFGTVLMLVLLIYFLISGRRVAAGVLWLVPPEYRSGVERVTRRMLPMLWRYFVGLIAVVSYTTGTAWIAFAFVFHVPHTPVLSIAVGVLELIPMIGPGISLALIGLTAIEQTSILGMLGLAVFAIGLRLSIDQIVGPLVLGHAVRLHPVVITFCVPVRRRVVRTHRFAAGGAVRGGSQDRCHHFLFGTDRGPAGARGFGPIPLRT
jgi:predicted PurR-regulated permease PerM